MSVEKSDSNPSDQDLLKMALADDTIEWEKLNELCLDRANAEKLAKALSQSTSRTTKEARSWAELLEEMHSGLKVKLAGIDDAA